MNEEALQARSSIKALLLRRLEFRLHKFRPNERQAIQMA